MQRDLLLNAAFELVNAIQLVLVRRHGLLILTVFGECDLEAHR